MKKHFFEYHESLTDSDKKRVFKNCIFVFDTNVLLNLYRYTAETRDEMLSIMDNYKERIWMPYQVGWEFYNNRETVINNVSSGCDSLKKRLEECRNSFLKEMELYKRHPYINKEDIEKLFKNQLEPVFGRLEKLKDLDPKYQDKDVIIDKLTSLFQGRVGEDYSIDELDAIIKEGERRYSYSIPPGYADLKTKRECQPRQLYGDLIVWKQTIDKAKESSKDIVFISDDQKDDWYEKKARGETKEPRRELVKEFGVATGGRHILLYNQEGFLYYIKEYLGDTVDSNAVAEVAEVADQMNSYWDMILNHQEGPYYAIKPLGDYSYGSEGILNLSSYKPLSQYSSQGYLVSKVKPEESLSSWIMGPNYASGRACLDLIGSSVDTGDSMILGDALHPLSTRHLTSEELFRIGDMGKIPISLTKDNKEK